MEEEKDILTEENNQSEIPVEAEMIDQAVEEAAEHAGGGDDGFFGKYIWDEETGRLYEITEAPKKKWDGLLPLLLIALPVTALAFGIAKGSSLLPPECYNGTSILSESNVGEQLAQPKAYGVSDAEAATAENSPGTEQATAPEKYTPCAIVIDGRTRAVLASTEAAESLLEEVRSYFDGKVTEAGDRTTELYGAVEMQPQPDAKPEDISSYDQVYEKFTSSSSPLKVITTVTSSETKELPFGSKVEKDPTLVAGTGITLSLGKAGSRTTVNHTVYINGEKSSSRSKSETVTVEPQDTVILQGTDKKSGGEPGRHEGKEGRKSEALSFASPVAGGKIISNYGQRDGILHLGLDYGAKAGDPVLSSEGGTVVCAINRGGYGNIIEIDHGEGFVTRYAHLSQFSVAPGDKVAKGQIIGQAGDSGSCTEAHLHFELRIDGIAYNPRYYIEEK
ncbi:MAG: peptidoglycan DD-metalloendopeptidase family protein [Eubacteriales bacterium]|nr:peptidoglycan DD-metalloendopeptidase family protein [Eubacteriales bacterium]